MKSNNLLLRKFNELGNNKFKVFLKKMQTDPKTKIPYEILTDKQYTSPWPSEVTISWRSFSSKKEFVHYIDPFISTFSTAELRKDTYLWNWLSLLYFESLCPKEKIKKEYHYLLDSTNYKRSYRHLLATPYMIFREIPDHNRIWLKFPLDVHGDMIEQTISRLYFIRLKGVREVIDLLYFDKKNNKPKKGTLSRTRAGSLQRLIIRTDQLLNTYDLHEMTGNQVINLLGQEFSSWQDVPPIIKG